MRALQKAVAEELELPPSVMSVFDRQDEEDDFSGIDEGSRGVIADIRTEIFRKLANSRFVVIFHNGSNEYIDLCESFGVPVISALSNKVLWTWHGRFRPSFHPKFQDSEQRKNMELHTDIFVNYFHDDCIRDEALLEEAKEVVTYMGISEPSSSMNHMIVEKCFQYAYALGSVDSFFPDGYPEDHASTLLVCDGIIKGEGDTSAWEVADALQRNMHLDWLLKSTDNDMHSHLQCRLPDHWVLEKCKDKLPDGIGLKLSRATSLFVARDLHGYTYGKTVTLTDGIFQHSHSSKLRTLNLYRCNFSFESPPFLCCSQLRFLQLVSCTDIPSDKHPSHNEEMPCFQKLWVLHLEYTHWNRLLSEEMLNFMADLRELCVYGVMNWRISDLRGTLFKVHVKDYEYRRNIAPFPNLSSSSFFKSIILEGCSDLKQVVPSRLPSLIESFALKDCPYYAKISNISFHGCSRLKSVLLTGNLPRLEELDLSGTAVKTLDLRKVTTLNLKRLVLLGCEKLCSILWPPENKRPHVLEVLHINTIRSTSPGQANWEEKPQNTTAAVGSSSILAASARELCIGPHGEFKWYIRTRDTRIFRSLEPVKAYIEHRNVYMEMDSSPTSVATVGDSEVAQGIRSLYQPNNYFYAREFFLKSDVQAGAGNKGAISWMWDCPAIPTQPNQDLYLHIPDNQEVKRGSLQQQQSNSAVLPPRYIVNKVRMLHVHDSSSITCITCPQGSYWRWLEWCRVERCPELHTVFCTDQQSEGDSFCQVLSTFWASELLKVRYIWDWSAMRVFSSVHIGLLHLDYCPRLIHVLPLSESRDTLPHLDTLEIVYCGDLREVFALDPKKKEQKIVEFPKLRRIHLFELPSLQHICGNRIPAPNLETVRIRGCWSLRSLPAVSRNNEKLPSVDCEKEWWDSLEWDGVEANHHPSLYDHIHSSYYKAQLPRGTVLR